MSRKELPGDDGGGAADAVQQEQQQRVYAARARHTQVPRLPQHRLRRERRIAGQGVAVSHLISLFLYYRAYFSDTFSLSYNFSALTSVLLSV